jgi:predicted flap endonuclease-1-like 5' DNA nuclease
MGILDRLLSALGLRSEGSSPDRGETTGAAGRVERERSSEAESTPHSPATEAENEPAASGTEAAGSTGSMVDVEEGVEPAEAAGPAAGASEAEAGESEEDEESEEREESEPSTTAGSGEEPAASGTEAAGSTGSMVDVEEGVEPAEAAGPAAENAPGADVVSPEHVDDDPDTIEGIGPAYAERLAGAGISTVGELAIADAEGVAEATGISEKRVSRWIERARAR